MRISDWSSDVCSSDLSAVQSHGGSVCRPLPTALDAAALDRIGAVEQAVQMRVVGIGAQDRQPGLLEAGQHIEDAAGQHRGDAFGRPEIGRPACRESLGRYVLISVAAGSLQKHTTYLNIN